jgi:hypothetical protein
MLPALLEAKGFVKAVTRRKGPMKFVDATRIDGGSVTFWLKQGWTDTRDYSAIQFGMLSGSGAAELPDADKFCTSNRESLGLSFCPAKDW